MSAAVIRRFIVLMALLTVAMFVFWDLLGGFVERAPGDYHTEVGSNRLVDGRLDEALEQFDLALAEMPDHRGALMGRALVFMRSGREREALAELDHLIGSLTRNLGMDGPGGDDPTGRGALAAAYANRGILLDRRGDHQGALESYVSALKTDAEAVEGPGVVDKILYGAEGVSSVRERAKYLDRQLKLPEEERLLRVPEIDDRQRMHKP